MLAFEHESSRKPIGILRTIPSAITQNDADRVPEWVMPDGQRFAPACISCAAQSCMKISSAEQSIPEVANLSIASNRDICPVNAIKWDPSTKQPSIDESSCIGCGLCVPRCPVGAIYMENNVAKISNRSNQTSKILDFIPTAPEQIARHYTQVRELPQIERSTPIQADQDVTQVYTSIAGLADRELHILVRSALINVGINAVLTRKGDVHTRNDGIYSSESGIYGPLEIEFGADSLEAVRAALDDVAVMSTVHGLAVSSQHPLVVVRFLPTERQSYWQVVGDTKEVLGIDVHTLSLGAILLLAWNGKKLDSSTIKQLRPVFSDTSIRKNIEGSIGRVVDLDFRYLGILEPSK